MVLAFRETQTIHLGKSERQTNVVCCCALIDIISYIIPILFADQATWAYETTHKQK